MRYFLLFCFGLSGLVFTKAAAAQSTVGVKLGMGLSMPDVMFSSDANYGNSTYGGGNNGMVIGLFTQLSLGTGWWLKPDLQVCFKGFKEKYNGYYGNYTVGNTTTYLQLPLNVVRSSGAKGTGFQIGGGPVIGYLLNQSFRNQALRTTDVGFNVLTGYHAPIGFSFNLAYTHGFGNVVKNTVHFTSLKNRFLAFTIGYLF